jgi:plasmid maintenance system antidote protein VapI
MTPFQYFEPEAYLCAWIRSRSRYRHPLRGWIAAQMGWSPSRISRILTGKSRITPAEARRLNEVLRHRENEAGYFLAMTQYGWAKKENRGRFQDEMMRFRTAPPN